jgi:hypothetical protein
MNSFSPDMALTIAATEREAGLALADGGHPAIEKPDL